MKINATTNCINCKSLISPDRILRFYNESEEEKQIYFFSCDICEYNYNSSPRLLDEFMNASGSVTYETLEFNLFKNK